MAPWNITSATQFLQVYTQLNRKRQGHSNSNDHEMTVRHSHNTMQAGITCWGG